MIKRYILHIEFHWGYRPIISFRKAPQVGDRVLNGGELGTLHRCPTCQEGFLHYPDAMPIAAIPDESEFPPDLAKYDNPDNVGAIIGHLTTDTGVQGISMVPSTYDQTLTELMLGPDSLHYKVGEIVWQGGYDHRVEIYEPGKRLVIRRLANS